ncbi:hypothetical protein L3Q82_005975 [Scortum barcoo]|uniref:Uncharacterized protein n=1 Tax=Scortum barcoo TaxID=214431 RepID=A0ACB8X361_9TELE|nr:hypothetical protein L3Q82_005975 [Scortum barcoo]
MWGDRVKTYMRDQPSRQPRLNRTMPDLADHDGLFIAVTQTYIHKAAIVASKSQINLQTRDKKQMWKNLEDGAVRKFGDQLKDVKAQINWTIRTQMKNKHRKNECRRGVPVVGAHILTSTLRYGKAEDRSGAARCSRHEPPGAQEEPQKDRQQPPLEKLRAEQSRGSVGTSESTVETQRERHHRVKISLYLQADLVFAVQEQIKDLSGCPTFSHASFQPSKDTKPPHETFISFIEEHVHMFFVKPRGQRSKMGGKLSKKKKGYNVNDDKAKDKDAKAEGASAEESEALKDNKDEAPAATDAKEVANDTAGQGGTGSRRRMAPKEEEKNAAPAAKEPEKPAVNAEPKTEAPKSAEPAKAEEIPAAPAPAKETAPAAKEPEAKAAAPAPAAESKDEADAKKTEAPAAPAAKAEAAPATIP